MKTIAGPDLGCYSHPSGACFHAPPIGVVRAGFKPARRSCRGGLQTRPYDGCAATEIHHDATAVDNEEDAFNAQPAPRRDRRGYR